MTAQGQLETTRHVRGTAGYGPKADLLLFFDYFTIKS
jgi:hypothetical protein